LLATNLALLKKYYQLAIVHIANAKSMLRNAYIPNEYTFRRKKLVRSLIFEMKLAYYIMWLVLAKLNQYNQSVKTIAHNTNAKHMLKNMITIVTIPAMRNVLLLS